MTLLSSDTSLLHRVLQRCDNVVFAKLLLVQDPYPWVHRLEPYLTVVSLLEGARLLLATMDEFFKSTQTRRHS